MSIRSAHTLTHCLAPWPSDVRRLGTLLSCTHCHRFPLHLLSDGTIQCGSCKAITAHTLRTCPATWGQLLASAVITSVPLV